MNFQTLFRNFITELNEKINTLEDKAKPHPTSRKQRIERFKRRAEYATDFLERHRKYNKRTGEEMMFVINRAQNAFEKKIRDSETPTEERVKSQIIISMLTEVLKFKERLNNSTSTNKSRRGRSKSTRSSSRNRSRSKSKKKEIQKKVKVKYDEVLPYPNLLSKLNQKGFQNKTTFKPNNISNNRKAVSTKQKGGSSKNITKNKQKKSNKNKRIIWNLQTIFDRKLDEMEAIGNPNLAQKIKAVKDFKNPNRNLNTIRGKDACIEKLEEFVKFYMNKVETLAEGNDTKKYTNAKTICKVLCDVHASIVGFEIEKASQKKKKRSQSASRKKSKSSSVSNTSSTRSRKKNAKASAKKKSAQRLMQECFKKYDGKKSGSLDKRFIHEFMKTLDKGIKTSKIKELLRSLNTSHPNQVKRGEAVKFFIAYLQN